MDMLPGLPISTTESLHKLIMSKQATVGNGGRHPVESGAIFSATSQPETMVSARWTKTMDFGPVKATPQRRPPNLFAQ